MTKTIERHKREGTYRPDRHGKRGERVAPAGLPVKPEDLGEEASRVWDVLISSRPADDWTPSDAVALELTCRWYASWRAALQSFDNVLDDYKALNVAATCSKNVFVGLSKLGCTPIDRTKLRTVAEDEGGEIESLLKAVS